MTALAVLLWLLNMSMDTFGHLAFKAAAGHGLDLDTFSHWKHLARSPWLWAGVVCYFCEFFVWAAFLSQVPLAAGVMLGSINIVVLMLAGRLMFRERLTPWRVAGILLITGGVALVGLGV
ncbi:MAG: EamA family transporter [Proteobacteria bacterium]|nr:EamA family transporter [Pseudomonadota bacterium]